MKKFNVKALTLFVFIFLGFSCLNGQVTFTANDFITPYNGPFGYGVNLGGYGTSSNISPDNGLPLPWTDDALAELCIGNPAEGIPGAGVNSMRLALPHSFLEDPNLSYDIRLEEFQRYAELGLRDHTVFLNSPSAAHRDFTEYCPGQPSEIFRNLHLPIWDAGANGTPYHDENYYARYVYEVVSRYGKWVKYWEVWNEPDFTTTSNNTSEPGTPGSWWTEDPSPCDLGGQFGIKAPISHYVRMLRITYEIVKTLYPESYVATGGLGYPSFLDAILRNTDNPNNGDVSAQYPLKGGAYFDVISWHYYPHVDEAFREWNNDIMYWDRFRHSDAAIDEFFERQLEFKAVLESRGYNGTTFPRKLEINTETNLPRVEVINPAEDWIFAGGDQLQANYNMKVMFASQVTGLDHLHLYHIGESQDANTVWTPQHQFNVMGLYKNLLTQNKNTAEHTDGGIAIKTMSDALQGYWYDAGTTNQLQLPSNVRGGAFTNGTETTFMLWAKTFRDRSEDANATYTFPSSFPWTNNGSTTLTKIEWDHFRTGAQTNISFRNVALTGNPIFLTLNNTVSPCDGLTVSVNSEAPTCFGYTNGTISVNAFNGIFPYSFLWEDGSTSPLRNNLTAGSYFVTVTDGNGCAVNQNIQLTSPSAINATLNIRNESVAGLNDGSITAFPSGGTPGYSYNWSDGSNSQVNSGLAAGDYVVTINDSRGCPVIKPARVEADDIGCGTFTMNSFKTDLTCFNSNNGTISANPMGGTGNITFQWNTGEITQFVENLPVGFYSVTATDELGCRATSTTQITSPSQLTLFVIGNDVSISGAGDGSVTAFANNGTPPYTYDWSNLGTTATINSLDPGVYSVTVVDANGCQAIAQTEINSPEPDCESFEISMIFNDPRCPDSNTGFVSANLVNGVPPFQFNWSTGAHTQTIGNLPAGTYFVTVIDGAGCPKQSAQTLQPKAPITVIKNITNASGPNIPDGRAQLQVNGGTPPFRAEWSTGDSGLDLMDVRPGAYSVTITDANNCVKTDQVIVDSESDDCAGFSELLWQSIDVSCKNQNEGAIILLPQGGQAPFEYNWSNGANTQGISNLFAGNYTVTVLDDNNCQHIQTITITEPEALSGGINANLSGLCGDVADLRAFGTGGTPPYTYSWSTGDVGSNLPNQGEGFYSVIIIDANGCTFERSFDFVVQNAFPGIGQTVQDASCNGEDNGFIDIEVLLGTAPFTYNWSTGSTAQDIGSLGAGQYSVTVNDANGCQSEHFFILSEPNPLEIEFDVLNPTSEDEKGSIKVEVFGGVSPYTYNWGFGATTPVVNNIDPGTYSVTVTDANGCAFAETVELSITSVRQNPVRDNAIEVYPNPSKDHFFIELPQGEEIPSSITIYDIHGKLVKQNAYTQHQNLIRMDVEHVVSGTYLVRIQFEDGYSLAKRIMLLN